MSPLRRPIGQRSTRSTPQQSRRAVTTTESRGCVRNTIAIITVPSYSILTATILKPCSTYRCDELADQLRPAEDPGIYPQGCTRQFVEEMPGLRADAVSS